MFEILTTEQFRRDLDNLDMAVRARIPKTVRLISEDPYYPGLGTEKQVTIQERSIMRSRVSQKYRLLWEWLPNGTIGLWRVGNHEFIDAFDSLPGIESTTWMVTADAPQQTFYQVSAVAASAQNMPFALY